MGHDHSPDLPGHPTIDLSDFPVAETSADLITILVSLRQVLRDAPERVAGQLATGAELVALGARCAQVVVSLGHLLTAEPEEPDPEYAAQARALASLLARLGVPGPLHVDQAADDPDDHVATAAPRLAG